MNLFENTPIRSAWVSETNRRWFSAVDVCAALTGSDYQKARNYWKWLKHKLDLQCRQLVRFTNQLKLEAADGKLRFTDVLDSDGVLRLILICPSPKADAFKLWIAKLTAEGAAVAECVAEAVNKAKDTVRRKIGGFFVTTKIKDFDIGAGDGTAGDAGIRWTPVGAAGRSGACIVPEYSESYQFFAKTANAKFSVPVLFC